MNEKSKQFIGLLSKMSFDVYIWHYPLMALEQLLLNILGTTLCRSYLSMVMFTLVVWVFAYLLYRYIETPINKTIRKEVS